MTKTYTKTYKDFFGECDLPNDIEIYDVGQYFGNQGSRAEQFPEACILEEGTKETPLEISDEDWEQIRIEFEEKYL